jgi:hypothetical protein
MPCTVCVMGDAATGVGCGTDTARIDDVDSVEDPRAAAPSFVATKLCRHLGHLMCSPSGGILLSLML